MYTDGFYVERTLHNKLWHNQCHHTLFSVNPGQRRYHAWSAAKAWVESIGLLLFPKSPSRLHESFSTSLETYHPVKTDDGMLYRTRVLLMTRLRTCCVEKSWYVRGYIRAPWTRKACGGRRTPGMHIISHIGSQCKLSQHRWRKKSSYGQAKPHLYSPKLTGSRCPCSDPPPQEKNIKVTYCRTYMSHSSHVLDSSLCTGIFACTM